MKKILFAFALLFSVLCRDTFGQNKTFTISKAQLKDKIKGGWAGQTIGVTFGGPYEFRFNGTFIGDYQTLLWHDGLLKQNMLDNPGLYDDLYMDLTFVAVFEKYGLSAPVDSFANAYAHAEYTLWHANQAGRYNILHGIKAPESGNWINNPHADDIDYQIESDYAGLMSPAMPNTASAISDKIGHIMNYGDGWYGGVFVGALYTVAFTSDDIPYIVNEALKTIPAKSDFHQCIQDVINWHHQFPGDWKQSWLMIQKKWANETGCPDGIFAPFDIDAKVNAAYVTMGLLYGGGNYTKSLEIAVRCGQDADCNPSTVGGVLGTVFGYEKIPSFWKQGLKEIEGIDFKYTTMSLHDVYEISYRHALDNIRQNGGKINGADVIINHQIPQPVKFEKSFDGLYPIAKIPINWSNTDSLGSFNFDGTGFVIKGDASIWESHSNFVLNTELYVDDKLVEKPQLPVNYTRRRLDIAWQYKLPKGRHSVKLKIMNPSKEYKINDPEVIIYSNQPVNGIKANIEAARIFK